MRIQNIMEMSERFLNAYDYYQKVKDKKHDISRDALIAQIARMFGLPNIKHFHSYVLQQEDSAY